jgi:hypothetical protein
MYVHCETQLLLLNGGTIFVAIIFRLLHFTSFYIFLFFCRRYVVAYFTMPLRLSTQLCVNRPRMKQEKKRILLINIAFLFHFIIINILFCIILQVDAVRSERVWKLLMGA